MRLRNIKDADKILHESKYFVDIDENMRGNWASIFGNDAPIMIEIGMGKGDFIKEMAQLHPEWNFIGVEKYESILARAASKLASLDLPNVRITSCDASKLYEYFDEEIDTIFLNFSDPWPKKRHHKRRLTYSSFLEIYDKISAGNTHLVMKTDNDSLFESSLVSLNNYGYTFDEILLDLWAHAERQNVRTEYEVKFGSRGFKIKLVEAIKKKSDKPK